MSNYKVHVTPTAFKEIKSLPGHIRHRIRRAISDLSTNPRPSQSKELSLPDVEREIRRLRLDKLMEIIGVMIEHYENANVPELVAQ